MLPDADGDAVETIQGDDPIVAVDGGVRVVRAVVRGDPDAPCRLADHRIAVVALAGAQRIAFNEAAVGPGICLARQFELVDQPRAA